ncbi:MAG TPA: hypothetical protein VH650_12505 [Gaiellaceae bacterium]|jgi:hypothetical protein
MRTQDELLGLPDESLVRELRKLLGKVGDDDLRDELAGVSEEIFERWSPDALKRETWRALIEEDYPEPDLRDLRARAMDELLEAWTARAGLRPLAQGLAQEA